MALELVGKIIQKLDVTSGEGARGPWRRQDIIVETIEQYAKKICVEFWNEAINDADKYNLGDTITVNININSREFNGKWYTSVRAWKVLSGAAGTPAPQQHAVPAPTPHMPTPPAQDAPAPTSEDFGASTDKVDDLPF